MSTQTATDSLRRNAKSQVKVTRPSVERLLRGTAPQMPLGSGDLVLQSLMHLPRLASREGVVTESAAVREIDRHRQLRAEELAPLRSLAEPPFECPSIDQLQLSGVDAAVSEQILGHFHYLRSFRSDGIEFAATARSRVVVVASLARLDIPDIAEALPSGVAADALVLTRVFAFNWAPRNAVSWLLAKIEKRPEVREARLLLTYVNPNLGFSGASYRASNWQRLGFEHGTRYAYLEGRYITDRRVASLPAAERALVDYSRMSLRPLMLFGRTRDARLEERLRSTLHVSRNRVVGGSTSSEPAKERH